MSEPTPISSLAETYDLPGHLDCGPEAFGHPFFAGAMVSSTLWNACKTMGFWVTRIANGNPTTATCPDHFSRPRGQSELFVG